MAINKSGKLIIAVRFYYY